MPRALCVVLILAGVISTTDAQVMVIYKADGQHLHSVADIDSITFQPDGPLFCDGFSGGAENWIVTCGRGMLTATPCADGYTSGGVLQFDNGGTLQHVFGLSTQTIASTEFSLSCKMAVPSAGAYQSARFGVM
ncbi:MAG: hypothetical protein GF331_12485, partial [Chitinivibrionales bacterium]|nr:hypothetical protein [Chitinivibrionales bacterium]